MGQAGTGAKESTLMYSCPKGFGTRPQGDQINIQQGHNQSYLPHPRHDNFGTAETTYTRLAVDVCKLVNLRVALFFTAVKGWNAVLVDVRRPRPQLVRMPEECWEYLDGQQAHGEEDEEEVAARQVAARPRPPPLIKH